jgi:hypothetical protein
MNNKRKTLEELYGAALKKRAKSTHPEDKLHREMVKYLRAVIGREGVAWCGVYWQSIEVRGKRSLIEGASNKARGCVAGFGELLIIHHGRIHLAEVKTPDGVLSQSQRETHPELAKAGAPVAVLRSIDDLVAWVRAIRMPTREARV